MFNTQLRSESSLECDGLSLILRVIYLYISTVRISSTLKVICDTLNEVRPNLFIICRTLHIK